MKNRNIDQFRKSNAVKLLKRCLAVAPIGLVFFVWNGQCSTQARQSASSALSIGSTGRHSVKTYKNLAYASGPQQKLDLFIPQSKTALPLLIYIHGGGWSFGDKAAFEPAPHLLDGFAVASINYRLTVEAPHPAQIDDVRSAVRWLKRNAKNFGLNPDQFIVFGESAGGHLAALLATTCHNRSNAEGNESEKILGAIDYSGPSNFTSMLKQCKSEKQKELFQQNGLIFKLLGGRLKNKTNVAKDASPVSHVSNSCPPILIVHGLSDPVIPAEQSIEFAEKLKSAGANPVLVLKPGMGHLLRDDSITEAARTFMNSLIKQR